MTFQHQLRSKLHPLNISCKVEIRSASSNISHKHQGLMRESSMHRYYSISPVQQATTRNIRPHGSAVDWRMVGLFRSREGVSKIALSRCRAPWEETLTSVAHYYSPKVAQAVEARKRLSLLELPGEIRNMVYRCSLVARDRIVIDARVNSIIPEPGCKFLNSELVE